MKKIIAFISSLLVIAPSFAQNNNAKDKNKTQGVSKVKQENVSKEPAGTNAKPSNGELKNANKMKGTSGAKNVKLSGTGGSAQKNSGNGN